MYDAAFRGYQSALSIRSRTSWPLDEIKKRFENKTKDAVRPSISNMNVFDRVFVSDTGEPSSLPG
jgi:hypothetical protein